MGNYSVPQEIRNLKPKGTMVKVQKGKYYVYNYKHIKENGKWKIKMEEMIGSITSDLGFVPNNSYNKVDQITTYDFGEYFLTYSLTKDILDLLKTVFNNKEATLIYNIALIHFVHGFTYMKSLQPNYELSYFSLKYPSIKITEHVVSNLLYSLGTRESKCEKFENILLNESSKELAVDGHAIKSSSHDNNLAEDGNKNNIFKDMQVNLMMAYDIKSSRPVLAKMYAGATMDNISFKDLFERKDFKETLFIIDKGFYSDENIKSCSANGNKYIIPLKAHLRNYKLIVNASKDKERFVYVKGKKKTIIEYKEIILEEKTKIILFVDLNQQQIECLDYLNKIGDDKGVYTNEKYEKLKDNFGTIVLQTNVDKTAEEIYKLYKQRWAIETFYDYFKNRLDANALHLSDYNQMQGLSFILLVTSLINAEFIKNTILTKRNTTDLLLDSKFIKLHKKQQKWNYENVCKRHLELFNSLKIDIQNEINSLNKINSFTIN